MSQLTIILNQTLGGLQAQSIFGLDLFRINEVHIPLENDPRIVFLRSLIKLYSCSAHTGPLAFEGDEAEETFTGYHIGKNYFKIQVGVHGGTFYSSSIEQAACFFPKVHDPYLRLDVNQFNYFLRQGSFALYIAPQPKDDSQRKQILSMPFIDEEHWIRAMLDIYPLIVVTGHDGVNYLIYTNSSEMNVFSQTALMHAEEAIYASHWYQENRQQLKWDEDILSLVLG